ncbi:GumC family protein [Flavobacterium agrisoli]|uniref:non-specific protein-tyrosine kinase n=1 Tax=Flavobacterium agrisoli TaxID=2793066 RepID=A0A934UL80_9FLAO|nr:tyrosine-protein kinase [Flavobacterium agrisoli]MBK0371279.1 polysaccharide biosynthesis tyrosine autokinase [Flavobacterium agrisoli]
MDFNTNEDFIEETTDLNEIVGQYLYYWRWFVLSIVLFLVGAFVYLRYAIPAYQVTTTILVKDEKKGGMLSELSAFSDMGLGVVGNNVDNEIEILKSRTIVESAVRKLNLGVSVIAEGSIIEANLYAVSPIRVAFVRRKTVGFKKPIELFFSSVTASSFDLSVANGADTLLFSSGQKKRFRYTEAIKTKLGDLVVVRNLGNKTLPVGKELKIVLHPFDDIVDSYRTKLQVTPLSKTSSVLSLSTVDVVPQKGEDFLNELVASYNADAVADKNAISENTSAFIANRLVLITDELDGVEQDVAQFKENNNITDIESDVKLYLEGSTEYNKKAVEIAIQSNVLQSMLEYLGKSSNSDLIPSNLLSGEHDASGLISDYNSLILNRNRILKSATPTNPTVVKLDQQIASLRSTIKASLQRYQSSLVIQQNNLSSREGELNSKISKVPLQEKKFRSIARQQKVKEELYLYLLQKREETAISLAATEPNARIIDVAKAEKVPVSPKRKIIYLAALLLGLLIPIGVIYILQLFDNKIKSRLDLEGKVAIPFIGDVPISESPNELIQSNSRSSTAEALRIIRTNLEFMVPTNAEVKAKTIFMTSTFPKEGKTFVSVNLAGTFALSGKKVLLIGMDIRNPRLDEYLSLPERGLTNYLSSKEASLEDLIVKHPDFENFYILPAGTIPPNPAELLMSQKIEVLFDQLKMDYDYIIVDTAPVSLVTDTLLIAKHADCFVYVVRSNFLEKRMLHIPNTLFKERKLPNMCLLLNATDTTKGYGYGYGYGNEVVKKSWYEKLLGRK